METSNIDNDKDVKINRNNYHIMFGDMGSGHNLPHRTGLFILHRLKLSFSGAFDQVIAIHKGCFDRKVMFTEKR